MDKTIRRVHDPAEQKAETDRYWRSVPPGERLTAVCELSESAYSFKGVRHDGTGSQRTLVRFERPRR
jgi:hypothetical protein